MIAFSQADILRGLKHCLCLAKQDLLFSSYLSNPDFWKTYASARQNMYRWLRSMILKHGVNHAYLLAIQRYEDLPFFAKEVETCGKREALEVFFLLALGAPPQNTPVKISN